MKLFHFWHRWSPGVKVASAERRYGTMRMDHINSPLVNRIAFGFSTYRQTCSICGEERTYEVLGNEDE